MQFIYKTVDDISIIKRELSLSFLAEMVILILGKDVQLFCERANYTFSPIKCFIFLFVL